MSTIATYPTLLIVPTLTFLTFGPIPINWQIDEKRIHFSFRLTWVNAVLTLCGSAVPLVLTWHAQSIMNIGFFVCAALSISGLGIVQIVLGVLSRQLDSEPVIHKAVFHVNP